MRVQRLSRWWQWKQISVPVMAETRGGGWRMKLVGVEVDRVKGSSTMWYVLSFRPGAGFKGDGFDLVLWVQVAPAFYAGGEGRPEPAGEQQNQG